MGACASKPNVLNGDAPEVVPENVPAKDATVAAEEEVKKEEGVIADHDADKCRSLNNLFNNEEGKGSAEEKEETSVQKACEVPAEAKKELELVEKVVDETAKADAASIDEKKIEEVKSENPDVEEVVKPSLESIPSPAENKADEEKEAPAEKTVEEVQPETENIPADEKSATEAPKSEEKKIEEKSAPEYPKSEASSVGIKKTEEKPATKKGKFWWDK
ncbi:uncharacterized protein LOC107812059 [Nicotiana tabacum]|uniref:Fibrous sheath CABYR-binding protein-like n=2 Tax=Nicotiana TaxID=4085 RepID=A0A1S4BUM6_TOBAC|nr:PREDICTED: fibrous sheath CABYR-binding protein-like [Nicotiana sylvestris]XP_016492576.1 PREDICTED: fibrous sheath CABYR-binding protein-like [Nicotiana tabacum]